ncbi:methyltransferase domain-containing protein [Flavobacteriaceae bacterium]|nr:methyltransferase domain-containing protein [Flavobacteriaceae bacterium]
MKQFFIKEGYKINYVNMTNDKVNDKRYWDKNRVLSSSVFQFPVYKFLSNYIKKNKIKTLIDVGCGIGSKLTHVNKHNPNLEIVGIDQADPIEYCEKAYAFGKWLVDDFEKPVLTKKLKAELLVCCDVIEHMEDPDVLLGYIKLMLKKDGIALISTPERDRLRGVDCNHSPNKFHIREWNYYEFETYLKSHGFEILDHFNQFPTKIGMNRFFFIVLVKRLLKFKPLKYNQVVILKLK